MSQNIVQILKADPASLEAKRAELLNRKLALYGIQVSFIAAKLSGSESIASENVKKRKCY